MPAPLIDTFSTPGIHACNVPKELVTAQTSSIGALITREMESMSIPAPCYGFESIAAPASVHADYEVAPSGMPPAQAGRSTSAATACFANPRTLRAHASARRRRREDNIA